MNENVIYFILGLVVATFMFLLFKDLILKRIFTNYLEVKAVKVDNKDLSLLDAEIQKLLNLVQLNMSFIDTFIDECKEVDGAIDPNLEANLLDLKKDLEKKAEAIHVGLGEYDESEVFKK